MAVRPITMGDQVRHLISKDSVTGTVIAIYSLPGGVKVLDVRSDENKIYYSTPASNWETTAKVEDLE